MSVEYRLKIKEKITQFEKQKLWNEDVEEDCVSKPLLPNKVDYLGEKLITRLYTRFSNWLAIKYFEGLIKEKKLIIQNVLGLENYYNTPDGAIITCNHFSPYDNYVVFRAIKHDLEAKKRNLYKVIKEGNYTNFHGLYGFFFRHCNTLPLSKNMRTLKKFLSSVSMLLNRGEKILIYPEQSMWRDYRKPRPLKNGAFNLAVKNKVPILPVFITMQDTSYHDEDGFSVPEYTVHFLEPLYSQVTLSDKENERVLKEKNYEAWKSIYEEVYGIPLNYEG